MNTGKLAADEDELEEARGRLAAHRPDAKELRAGRENAICFMKSMIRESVRSKDALFEKMTHDEFHRVSAEGKRFMKILTARKWDTAPNDKRVNAFRRSMGFRGFRYKQSKKAKD